jgi:hypothetical protein
MTGVELITGPLTLLDEKLLLVALIILGAGIVKGTIGFGLPLVGVSLLSSVVPVQLAVAIIAFPILVSNLWLGVQGHCFLPTLGRFWTVIMALGLGIFAGARLLIGADETALLLLVGCLVIGYALFESFRPEAPRLMAPRAERPLGIVAGLVGGLLGGLSTAWGPPVLMYLSAQRLPKDLFVSTVGVIWSFASLFLIASFSSLNILTIDTAILSAMALLPMLAGMFIGQRLRRRIDQQRFQRMVLIVLALVGVNLLRRALT